MRAINDGFIDEKSIAMEPNSKVQGKNTVLYVTGKYEGNLFEKRPGS